MKKEKSVFFGILLAVIIIVSVGFISAEFSDGITGQVSQAEANVQVTGTAVNPIVVWTGQPNSTNIPIEGCTFVSLNFYAWSSAGASVLLLINGANANGSLVGSYGGGAQSVVDDPCTYINTFVDDGTYGHSGDDLVNYSCEFELCYYYDSGIWNILTVIEDISGRIGINNSESFVLPLLTGFRITPNYVNWTNVLIGGTNQLADNNITLINQGNRDINASYQPEVNSTHLNGTASGKEDEQLLAEWFAAGQSDSCNGDDLLKDVYVDILPFLVDHETSNKTTAAREDMEFCLKDLITGVSPQIFSTVERDWLIEVDFNTV